MNFQKVKKRFFEYGFTVGFLPAGPLHSIADVGGVTVGHTTKIEGESVRTGVTLIDPGVEDLFKNKIPAAVYVGNGFGKLAGSSQVEELGTLEAPIALTNTLAVGSVLRGVVDLVIKNEKPMAGETINVVVGETNDGNLNDIHAHSIDGADVFSAYDSRSKNFLVGNVGAGCGTRAFSWKGGIGTASRIIRIAKVDYRVGVLVQTNYGGSLMINGVPVGALLKKNDFTSVLGDGSCMIIIATDAPVDARQLKRIAKRGIVGLVRTGSVMSHGSGDYVISFSTNRAGLSTQTGPCIPDSELTGIFLAAAEATEEAVYDALFAAETMTGRSGNTLEALPTDEVVQLLKKYEY